MHSKLLSRRVRVWEREGCMSCKGLAGEGAGRKHCLLACVSKRVGAIVLRSVRKGQV